MIQLVFLVGLLCWFVVFVLLDMQIDKQGASKAQNVSSHNDLHVLIVMRNEALNIGPCLASINDQEGLHYPIKVTLVDDHSSDSSIDAAKSASINLSNLQLTVISSTGEGKKAGLQSGIDSIEERLIYLTDADCVLSPNTISTLMANLQSSTKAVFGPVLYAGNSFFDRLIRYENLNTQAVTEALLAYGQPLMANGGNLLLVNEGIDQYKATLANGLVSGDDVSFAQKLQREEYELAYHAKAVVTTETPSNLNEFIMQRTRWVRKYGSYPRFLARVLPAILFALNALFIALQVLWLAGGLSPVSLTMLLIAKFVIEWSFHSRWFSKYDQRADFVSALVLTWVYPIYYALFGIWSLTAKQYVWKGRLIASP